MIDIPKTYEAYIRSGDLLSQLNKDFFVCLLCGAAVFNEDVLKRRHHEYHEAEAHWIKKVKIGF